MAGKHFPSGDPVADRRAAYAETMAHLGDLGAAIEVMAGAMEIAPNWAAGWFRLGELQERAGDKDQAILSWERAVAADPADPLGAGLKRDLARAVPVAETLPPAFVELLFDQYAPRFEASLLGKLEYRGPALMAEAVEHIGVARFARVLDLGCGTGLVGEVVRGRCDWLEGYDLSDGMLAEARAKGVYDLLERRDIGALAPVDPRYSLILASDVFNYIGALERVIGWCAGALLPGGALIFTVEAGEQALELQESRRFRHSADYVAGLLGESGFEGITITPCVLRQDRGVPVEGFTVIASLAQVQGRRLGDGEAEAFA